MDDHDHGDASPVAGVSRGIASQDVLAKVGLVTGAGGGAADAPAAGDPPGEGAPGRLPRPKKRSKRRKRRRGRCVFARDASVPCGAGNAEPQLPVKPEAASGANGTYVQHNGTSVQLDASLQNGAVASVVRRGRGFSRTLTERPAYAALDLGTNNCRLLVAVPNRPGHFRVVDAFSRIVRLGEGLSTSGRLSEAAMDRAVEALQVCAEKLNMRELKRSRLIATEACRSAENGAAFLERVRAETGIELEIIDRRTEARLAVSGCGTLVERGTHGVVLFDIGGGSSEIALIDVSRHRTPRLADHIVSWTSLPVGVVSLAERYGGRHVTRRVFEAMVDHVAVLLAAFEGRERLAHVASGGRFHLLGTSGTVTTLAGVHLGLERYERRRVDGLWMDSPSIDRMIETLLSWDFDRRRANPCIGADRADLVLAGCAILEAIRRHWPAERLRVADRGLREGMLSEMMAADGVWRRRRRGTRGS